MNTGKVNIEERLQPLQVAVLSLRFCTYSLKYLRLHNRKRYNAVSFYALSDSLILAGKPTSQSDAFTLKTLQTQ